jgi:2-dehydro-3-deoxyglucarate aldolase/4-hydroxy-2-oxoheptanedioate aldolase
MWMDKMAAGETIYGTMLVELHTPNIARMLKVCGFDYFIIDCEHGYFDYSMVANLSAVAGGCGLSTIVRIPKIDRECILKYIEMGIDGFLIPMVSSAEELREAIQYVKYSPLGSRGVSTVRAHTGYGVKNLREYMNKANAETIVLAQIETVGGLERLDGILDVEGLNGVMVGPNDLLQDMGLTGEYNHPRFQEAIRTIAAAAGSRGKWSGNITSNIALLQASAALGMKILSYNSEVGMMMQGAKDGLAKLKG